MTWDDTDRQLRAEAEKGSWKAAARLSELSVASRDADLWARRARALAESEVEEGNLHATAVLSWILRHADPDESIRLARIAADKGDSGSMGFLALELRDRAPDEARRWEEAGVEAGDYNALQARGTRLLSSDRAAALRLLLEAAELGNRSAMETLGLQLFLGDQREDGLAWLRRAVEAGSISAQYQLGRLQLGIVPAAAEVDLRAAADRGHVRAKRLLSDILVASDPGESRRLLQEVCTLGDEDACRYVKLNRLSWLSPATWLYAFGGWLAAGSAPKSERLDVDAVRARMRFSRYIDRMLELLVAQLRESEIVVVLALSGLVTLRTPKRLLMLTTERMLWTETPAHNPALRVGEWVVRGR